MAQFSDLPSGTIAGKSFWELPGSPTMDVGEDDCAGTRIMYVAWADVNAILFDLNQSIIDRPVSNGNTDSSLSIWPGSYGLTDSWQTKLAVKNVNVSPAWDGNQKNITVDSDSTGSYDYALLTITYGLETEPRMRTLFTTRTKKRKIPTGYTFGSGLAEGDDAPVELLFPSQDIQTFIRTSDLNPDIPREQLIRNLEVIEFSVGTMSSGDMTLYHGGVPTTFPKNTVQFDSWEMRTTTRFGKLEDTIMYRFVVSEAYLFDRAGDAAYGQHPYNNQNGFNRVWSLEDLDYIPLTEQAYNYPRNSLNQTINLNQLFPASWGV